MSRDEYYFHVAYNRAKKIIANHVYTGIFQTYTMPRLKYMQCYCYTIYWICGTFRDFSFHVNTLLFI